MDVLTVLVRETTSLAQVLSKLELPTDGRSHHELKQRLAQLGIDTSHLRGQGWSRGETKATHRAVAR